MKWKVQLETQIFRDEVHFIENDASNSFLNEYNWSAEGIQQGSKKISLPLRIIDVKQ